MVLITPGSVNIMSTIITVYGYNFGLMVSDKRQVTPTADSFAPKNEDFSKIFKVTPNLLFGSTGLFNIEEELDDPFIGAGLSLKFDGGVQLIRDYIQKHFDSIGLLSKRTYMLLGFDDDGNRCLFKSEYKPDIGDFSEEIFRFKNQRDGIYICMALPRKLVKLKSEFEKRIQDVITKTHDINATIQVCSDIIKDISMMDDSVNSNIQSLTI